MHRRAVLLLTFCLAASGCGHKAWMESQVDPNYQPSRGDALFVTLPRQPSIQERQLLPILTTQLCADGFNLVPRIEQSLRPQRFLRMLSKRGVSDMAKR